MSKPVVAAESITLKVPVVTDSPVHHQYFLKLLTLSFAAIDQKLSLPPVRMPQQRAMTFLRTGQLDVFWMLVSSQHNDEFVRIDVVLAESLTGQQVLLIRPQDQPRFAIISSLQDLSESGLTAGLSAAWGDAEIGQNNGLQSRRYEWNWQAIYRDLHSDSSGIDNFPRR